MIVDAKTMSHEGYRKFSTLGAIASALDGVDVDESVQFDAVKDFDGNPVTLDHIRAAIHKVKGKRKFVTRLNDDGTLFVHRVE